MSGNSATGGFDWWVATEFTAGFTGFMASKGYLPGVAVGAALSLMFGTVGAALNIMNGMSPSQAMGGLVGSFVGGFAGGALGGLTGAGWPIQWAFGATGGLVGGDLGAAAGGLFDNPTMSPLVLDLDGDGIELTTLESSATAFDLDGDGFLERTAWAAGDDGVLAFDRNGNGTIDDVSELFGSPTTDGFVHLALLDTNADGRINAQDTEFMDLLVWKETDDWRGFASTEELSTLGELGIAEIQLNYNSTSAMINGNPVSSTSTFLYTNGTSHRIVDAWFQVEKYTSEAKLDASFEYDSDVFTLPQLRGSGIVPSLWISMTEDAILKDMVATLVNQDFSSFGFSAFSQDVETLLFYWIGVEDVNPTSRGGAVDARIVEAAERLLDQPFLAFGSADPNVYSAALLQDWWQKVVEQTASKILVQLPGLELMGGLVALSRELQSRYVDGEDIDGLSEPEILELQAEFLTIPYEAVTEHPLYHMLGGTRYSYQFDAIIGEFGTFMAALEADEPTNQVEKETYWSDLLPMINAVADSLGVSNGEYQETLSGTHVAATTQDGPLLQHRYEHTYIGTAARDVIDLSGEEEGNNNKFLAGGGGDDRINAAYGSNTFYYNLGDGKDSYRVWNQDAQDDKILFGEDVSLQAVTSVTQSTDSVRINFADGGEIFVENQLESKLGGIEYIEFWDGAIYTSSEFLAQVRGVDYSTNPSDVVYAVNAGGLPISTGGKAYQEDAPYLTTIYVSARSQTGTAIANTTDDEIYRTQRHDTEDFGYDIHVDNGTYEVTLKFAELFWNAAGARKFDVKMEGILVEDDLDVFNLAGGKNSALERVHYVTITDENLDLDLLLGSADNPMISGFVIRSVSSAPTISGTSSGNSLVGTPGSELIQGLEGNDTLVGGRGHDTVDGGAGRDTLTGGAGEDIFRFSALTHSQGAVGSDPAIYDRITDFENHIDKIDLTGLGFVRFITSGASQAGELRAAYSSASDRTYVKSDQLPFSFYLDGNRVADLDSSDFLLDPSAGNMIYGTLSADSLTGSSLDDTMIGLLGDDTLTGGSGYDTLNGSVGEDRLTGGIGADVFKFTGLTHSVGTGGLYDRIVDFQDGIDKIDVSDLGFTGLVSGVTNVGELRFTVNSGGTRTYVHSNQSDFEFYLDGNWGSTLTAADFIFYTPPSEGINGTAAADTLTGTSAGENLRGLGGDDTLSGGNGNDTLNGGADEDRLTGGAGADIFQFTDRTHSLHTGGFYDRIVDFEDGIDKIDLSGLGFTTLTTGTPQIDQLKLTYSSASNRTYVKNDPTDFSFFLDGDWVSNGLLTNADFIFA